MNGEHVDFDPELTFQAAVQDFHQATALLGDNPDKLLAAAQVQALLVAAHQLGAIARYYERAEEILLPPYVHTNDTSADDHKPEVDVRELLAKGAETLASWARRI